MKNIFTISLILMWATVTAQEGNLRLEHSFHFEDYNFYSTTDFNETGYNRGGNYALLYNWRKTPVFSFETGIGYKSYYFEARNTIKEDGLIFQFGADYLQLPFRIGAHKLLKEKFRVGFQLGAIANLQLSRHGYAENLFTILPGSPPDRIFLLWEPGLHFSYRVLNKLELGLAFRHAFRFTNLAESNFYTSFNNESALYHFSTRGNYSGISFSAGFSF